MTIEEKNKIYSAIKCLEEASKILEERIKSTNSDLYQTITEYRRIVKEAYEVYRTLGN